MGWKIHRSSPQNFSHSKESSDSVEEAKEEIEKLMKLLIINVIHERNKVDMFKKWKKPFVLMYSNIQIRFSISIIRRKLMPHSFVPTIFGPIFTQCGRVTTKTEGKSPVVNSRIARCNLLVDSRSRFDSQKQFTSVKSRDFSLCYRRLFCGFGDWKGSAYCSSAVASPAASATLPPSRQRRSWTGESVSDKRTSQFHVKLLTLLKSQR